MPEEMWLALERLWRLPAGSNAPSIPREEAYKLVDEVMALACRYLGRPPRLSKERQEEQQG